MLVCSVSPASSTLQQVLPGKSTICTGLQTDPRSECSDCSSQKNKHTVELLDSKSSCVSEEKIRQCTGDQFCHKRQSEQLCTGHLNQQCIPLHRVDHITCGQNYSCGQTNSISGQTLMCTGHSPRPSMPHNTSLFHQAHGIQGHPSVVSNTNESMQLDSVSTDDKVLLHGHQYSQEQTGHAHMVPYTYHHSLQKHSCSSETRPGLSPDKEELVMTGTIKPGDHRVSICKRPTTMDYHTPSPKYSRQETRPGLPVDKEELVLGFDYLAWKKFDYHKPVTYIAQESHNTPTKGKAVRHRTEHSLNNRLRYDSMQHRATRHFVCNMSAGAHILCPSPL